MSGKLVGLVMRGVHGVSHCAKCVLIVLAEHAKQETSPVYPGHKRIAAMIGLGERRIREGLAELETAGWIRKVPKTGHGPGNPAKYAVDFAAMRQPATDFDRDGTLSSIKPADHAGINAVNVRRIWGDEKRRILRPKAAESTTKAAYPVGNKAADGATRTVVLEPYKATVVEPARAPASKGNGIAASVQQATQPLIDNLKAKLKPPRQTQGRSQAEQLAWIAAQQLKEGKP